MTDTPTRPNPPTAPAAIPAPGAHPIATRRTLTGAQRRAEAPDRTTTRPVHWAILAALVLVAIAVRLQEPMSSPVIGAEDPYRHMERTWDLVQGKGFSDYPPGINLILLPFTFLGAQAFYMVSMYIPLAFAGAMVVGMFLLGRHYIHPSGALVSATLMAVMPEAVRRTDLLFPTALDLAILPFLFLAVLKASEGNRRALVAAGILGAFLLISHPWAMALLAPPLVVFALVMAYRRRPQHRKAVVGAAIGLGVLAVALVFSPLTQATTLLANPPQALPAYVDLPAQLTLPGILLGCVGAVLAFRTRDRFSVLALAWTGLLLPLVLVDWFGLWFLPHRTVVYMALGVAMLAGVPIAELVRLLKDTRPQAQPGVTFGAVGLALLVMTPSGLATTSTEEARWYRTFSEAELEAWRELDAAGTPYVMAGSWEARAGYRATTGRAADFNPGFFADPLTRQIDLRNQPDLVVLVDCHTSAEVGDTSFLQTEGWRVVGEWGDASCPKEPRTGLPLGWTAAYTRG